MAKLRLYPAQSLTLFFCAFAACNINIATDIAGEFSPGGVSRNTTLIDPAIFPISSPEPIFHPEGFSGLECRQEAIEASLQIVWMHAFGPPHAHSMVRPVKSSHGLLK